MAIIPTRYVYVLVALVLLGLFYATKLSTYDIDAIGGSHPALLNEEDRRTGQYGKAEGAEYRKSHDSTSSSESHSDPKLDPHPLFQKPDVLSHDDTVQQTWSESTGSKIPDPGEQSMNIVHGSQDAIEADLELAATVVYSPEGSKPTWAVAEKKKDDTDDRRHKSAGTKDADDGRFHK